MRLVLVIGIVWTAVMLGVSARTAASQSGSADPATWPTPNPDPSWYYYDLGPFDDAAYRPVTIAEIVADPFQFDGQLVRVRGQYTYGSRPVPMCAPPPATRPPTIEPGYLYSGSPMSLTDASGELGVLVRGKQGDSLGGQDELALATGASIELRGLLRAAHREPACRRDVVIATAHLAIQRTDPAIPFKTPAQDVGRKLPALPPGGLQDEIQPTAPPTP